jgi:hypothetical protein
MADAYVQDILLDSAITYKLLRFAIMPENNKCK